MSNEYECDRCKKPVNPARWEIGYTTCHPCGAWIAKKVVHTIVPMHKSNYIVVTNREDLKGINNKGGFYR